jgi:3,4-dihydroxy-9,10-secoandrosta-1,3,5(10)-triene-9,17-dione 4,5-dioxygenase
MVEVEFMDDVGRALDRALKHGVPIDRTLGRHTNDGMTSFYMMTPGGFAIEYGMGGQVVNWDTHVVYEDTKGSHWGHARPSGQ